MTPHRTLDCRGLSEAIVVLRIKQAIECAAVEQPQIHAQISEECCAKSVRAGLHTAAECVSLMEADEARH